MADSKDNGLATLVPPEVHSGDSAYVPSDVGDELVDVSFRIGQQREGELLSVESGLFPWRRYFQEEIIEDDPDGIYTIPEVILTIDESRVTVRWGLAPEEVYGVKILIYSNKNDNEKSDWYKNPTPDDEEWVTGKRSYRMSSRVLLGERLDIIFVIMDQERGLHYVTSNAHSFYYGYSLSTTLSKGYYWSLDIPIGYEITNPYTKDFKYLDVDINPIFSIQGGYSYILWDSISKSGYYLEQIRLDIFMQGDGSLLTTVLIDDVNAVVWVLNDELITNPYDIQIHFSLKFRDSQYGDSDWYIPNSNVLMIHTDSEINVTQSAYLSEYWATPKKSMRLVHPSLRDGESNLIRELDSLLYLLAWGIEKLKSRQSIAQELSSFKFSGIQLRELPTQHIINAAVCIKSSTDYLKSITDSDKWDVTIESEYPLDIFIDGEITDEIWDWIDTICNNLPLDAAPVTIRNDEIPCTLYLDDSTTLKKGWGILDDCAGVKYNCATVYLILKENWQIILTQRISELRLLEEHGYWVRVIWGERLDYMILDFPSTYGFIYVTRTSGHIIDIEITDSHTWESWNVWDSDYDTWEIPDGQTWDMFYADKWIWSKHDCLSSLTEVRGYWINDYNTYDNFITLLREYLTFLEELDDFKCFIGLTESYGILVDDFLHLNSFVGLTESYGVQVDNFTQYDPFVYLTEERALNVDDFSQYDLSVMHSEDYGSYVDNYMQYDPFVMHSEDYGSYVEISGEESYCMRTSSPSVIYVDISDIVGFRRRWNSYDGVSYWNKDPENTGWRTMDKPSVIIEHTREVVN